MLTGLLLALAPAAPCPPVQQEKLRGYLGVPMERVDEEFGGGFCMHVAAWPLLEEYPGNKFQTGLFGTWMFSSMSEPRPHSEAYSDIEGGLGWWRDTRFATPTPKFIMGGVALDFQAWANGPGAGKGRDWNKPSGKYGVAQLSPWILWPPDGLNLAQGTCGELLGYGYLPLPLTEPKPTTGGAEVPTGNQCWTLFLDAANFKGPVAFFTPHFFASVTQARPDLAGEFLDARPADPNRQLQMETQYVPSAAAVDRQGRAFAQVAPTRFPVDAEGESVLVHRVTSFRRRALWPAVEEWFAGAPVPTTTIDPEESVVHSFKGDSWSTWTIDSEAVDAAGAGEPRIDWTGFATLLNQDPHTFGYSWDESLTRTRVGKDRLLVTLPETYELELDGEESRWMPLGKRQRPPGQLRKQLVLPEPPESNPQPYTTPDDGCWSEPGPVAGPFEAELGDGSVVTYSWYRFADQPALLNAGLTAGEREQLQERAELLHRHWTRERQYLPPPTRGTLAELDPALIVEPPRGFELGYVPIVTRQAAR